jgi:hypothetical protein
VPYVIDGWIPEASVNIAVGDSGIGKSALFYQLGICVAAGVPFLDNAVQPGRVIMADYENGYFNQSRLIKSLERFLNLQCPEDFRVISDLGSLRELDKLISDFRPALAIIDSLRMFDPRAEMENSAAGEMLKTTHSIARKNKTAFVLIHHVRKPDDKKRPKKLIEDHALAWLLQAAGPRAFVNQTDVRIALESGETGEILVKVYTKLSGESGLMIVERVFDNNGEPIGYRRKTGAALLKNAHQQQALESLPLSEPFSFTEAKRIYGRSDQATIDWLRKCQGLGLVERFGNLYRRVTAHPPSESSKLLI